MIQENIIIPRKQRKPRKLKQSQNTEITYHNFFDKGRVVIDLFKYKVPELKKIAKYNGLLLGGNKLNLIERITYCFYVNLYAEKIQRCVRGFFVRRMFKLRGNLSGIKCVNESDFYTLEPLIEIPKEQLFTYSDEDGFSYGFNIHSFINLLKRKGISIANPYNRGKIPIETIRDAIHFYFYMILFMKDQVDPEYLENANHGWMNNLIRRIHMMTRQQQVIYRTPTPLPSYETDSNEMVQIIIPQNTPRPRPRQHIFFDTDSDTEIDEASPHPIQLPIPRPIRRESFLYDEERNPEARPLSPVSVVEIEEGVTTPAPNSPGPDINAPPRRVPRLRIMTFRENSVLENPENTESYREHMEQIQRKMESLNNMSLNTRIQEIFMEMDQLGNYTSVDWFTSLNKRRCFTLYSNLYDNWTRRSRLPSYVRNRICPLQNPFHGFPADHVMMDLDDFTDVELIIGCVIAMENMVYTAYDVEDRKLGAFQVLTALTAVSEGARDSFPWLYEAMYG